jgi:hypothetical protein
MARFATRNASLGSTVLGQFVGRTRDKIGFALRGTEGRLYGLFSRMTQRRCEAMSNASFRGENQVKRTHRSRPQPVAFPRTQRRIA